MCRLTKKTEPVSDILKNSPERGLRSSPHLDPDLGWPWKSYHREMNVSSTLTNSTIWFVAALSLIVDVRTYVRTDVLYHVDMIWHNLSHYMCDSAGIMYWGDDSLGCIQSAYLNRTGRRTLLKEVASYWAFVHYDGNIYFADAYSPEYACSFSSAGITFCLFFGNRLHKLENMQSYWHANPRWTGLPRILDSIYTEETTTEYIAQTVGRR